MTRQSLWVILRHLQGKGRREIEEILVEMKERDREERKINEREEMEEIITSPPPPTFTCCKDSRPCLTVSQKLDALVSKDT